MADTKPECIQNDRLPVEVVRTVETVTQDEVFTVDTFCDKETDQVHYLLWDLVTDKFFIGFRFYTNINPDRGYDMLVFDHVDVMPDKRTAMQAWLNLTKED